MSEAEQITDIGTVLAWAPDQSAADDAVIDRCISAASQAIEESTRRRIIQPSADITEIRDGSGRAIGGRMGEVLMLQYAPVVSVTTVTENGTVLTVAEGYSTTADAILDRSSGRLIRQQGTAVQVVSPLGIAPTGWCAGVQNITIAYLPGYGTLAPTDIEEVCCELAWLYYRESRRQGKVAVSRTGGSTSLVHQLSKHAQDILNAYRTWRPAA